MYQKDISSDAAQPFDLDARFAEDKSSLLARIARWGSPILSVAMLVAILHNARDVDLTELLRLPAHPLFWVCLVLSYLATPVSEWIIYRRLWKIPADGLVALLKKQVSNELLMGYLGDAQFYLWARRRTDMTGTPFAAVKDVSILSAMAGNAATLLLLVLGWPYLSAAHAGVGTRTIVISVGVMLASSLLVFLFRRKLFSLPRPTLWFVTGIHMARIGFGLAVMAAAWQLLLPHLPLSWLLLLAMLRMLISRLPLVPNKDVMFAGVTLLLLGSTIGIGEATTKIALLTLAGHIGVGLVILAVDGEIWGRKKAA